MAFLDLGIMKGVIIPGSLVMVATTEVLLDFPSIGVARKRIHRPNKWELPPVIFFSKCELYIVDI